MRDIENECIDLIFADPPYNLSNRPSLGWKFSKHLTMKEPWDIFEKDDFYRFNLEWITECVRILKPGGSLWVSGSFHNVFQLGFILQGLGNVKINNSVVWFKPNAQPNISCRMFTESTEHLIWAVKRGKKWTFNYGVSKSQISDKLNPSGKQTRNVWQIPVTPAGERKAGRHPAQKPVELLRRIILTSSREGDIVFDPFIGSGTTALVARMLNRRFMGCDLNPEYVKLAKKRVRYYPSAYHHKTHNDK